MVLENTTVEKQQKFIGHVTGIISSGVRALVDGVGNMLLMGESWERDRALPEKLGISPTSPRQSLLPPGESASSDEQKSSVSSPSVTFLQRQAVGGIAHTIDAVLQTRGTQKDNIDGPVDRFICDLVKRTQPRGLIELGVMPFVFRLIM